MMKKTTVLTVVMIMMLLANKTKAGVSLIENGSFEYNDWISDITVEAPNNWDVNAPAGQFGGWVWDDWATHGQGDYYYSLSLYSKDDGASFTNGDMAMVSQQVYLTDVNQIMFDVKLGTTVDDYWDPNERSALLLIDGNDIWNSDDLGPSENGDGEYLGEIIDVNKFEGYKDANLHTLSLAIRVNKDEASYWGYDYLVQWDFVRFDTHFDCGGFDYPPGDISRDCYVDWLDLEMLALEWLQQHSNDKYDLFPDGDNIVNFIDFAVLANSWMGTDFGQGNQILTMDLNNDGIVNFHDYAYLVDDWGSGAVDYNDISALTDEWLWTNWRYGLE